jgi:eukaryotic-like serine/threonine-protein kinase
MLHKAFRVMLVLLLIASFSMVTLSLFSTDSTGHLQLCLGTSDSMVAHAQTVSGAKFHADLSNTGVYDDGGVRPSNSLAWSYPTGGYVAYSSPAIVNGVIYVGSDDNKVYALNAVTGVKMWEFTTGGIVDSSPAVADGVVYVGSNDHKLYALNAVTGVKIWEYLAGDVVFPSPAVANGIVYFASEDTKVYALNAVTGVEIWEYSTNGGIRSSPAVVGGVVYIGSADGKLYAINAASGNLNWAYATGYGISSSPAVVDGVVYFGNQQGTVYAVDTNTHGLVWSFAAGAGVTSSPAVEGGVVYFGSIDNKVYALNANTGTKLWEFTTGNVILSSPAVASGVVYIGSEDNYFYALDASTGSQIWRHWAGGMLISSPAVAGGIVYFGSYDNNIYALGNRVENLDTGLTYATIQAAIDDPLTLNGHHIAVASGTYAEPVIVSKSLTITGHETGRPVLTSPSWGIRITAPNVVIDSIDVSNCAGGCYDVEETASGTTIRNSTVTTSPNIGVYLNGAVGQHLTDVTLINVVESGCLFGLDVSYADDCLIQDCFFNSNPDTGMLVSGSNITINRCQANNNANLGISYSADHSILKNCIFSGNNYNIETFATADTSYIYLNQFLSPGTAHGYNQYQWAQYYSPIELYYTYDTAEYRDILGDYWEGWTAPDTDDNGIVDVPYPLPNNAWGAQPLVTDPLSLDVVDDLTIGISVTPGAVWTSGGLATVTAQLYDDGEPLHQAGISVDFTIDIWDYLGLAGGSTALTDDQGIATTTVRGASQAGTAYVTATATGYYPGSVPVHVLLRETTGTKFRSFLNNSGIYDDGGTRPGNSVLWTFNSGSIASSPTVVNGIAYYGSNDKMLHAVYTDTGLEAWSYTTGHYISSSPAVSSGTVYFGSEDGFFYALDAATGTFVWNTLAAGVVDSSPAVVDSVVYVGSTNGNLYSLNEGDGSTRWSYGTGGWIGSSPAVVNGVVYIGSSDGYLYAVYASGGTLKWRFNAGANVYSSPAVVDGVVYLGCTNGEIYAIDADTGNQLWHYTTVSSVYSSPAVVDGVVYIGGGDNTVCALNAATGNLVWQYHTIGPNVFSSPAVANGVVYVGCNDYNVYAINAADGSLRWRYATGGAVSSSPAVVDGVVYVGSGDGKLYALGNSEPAPVADFTADVTIGISPLQVQFTDTSTNSPTSWQWSFGDGSANSTAKNPVHVYVDGGRHTVTLTAYNASGSDVIQKVNYIAVTTPVAWKFHSTLNNSGIYDDGGVRPGSSLIWSYTTGGNVYSSPAVVNGIVYVGSEDGKIYAFDEATGTLVWSYTTGGAVTSSPAVVDGVVYIGSNDHNVYALDAATGAYKWSYTTGAGISSSPAVANGIVYIGCDDHSVYALDADDGTPVWSHLVGSFVVSAPAVVNGVVYFGCFDGNVYALNTADGSPKWTYSTGSPMSSSPAVVDGVVYIGNNNNILYVLDASTGALLWSFTADSGGIYTSPAVADGIVYFGSGNGRIYALHADDGTPVWDYYDSNNLLSSPAVANGRVYIGSQNYRLNVLDAASGAFLWSYPTGNWVQSSPAVANGKVYFGCMDGKVYALGNSGPQPEADFSADITSGFVPLRVHFTDASTNSPTSWEWNFGDGSNNQSTQNPQHTFMNPGVYTVTLTVTNAGGSDSEVKTGYVMVFPGKVFGGTGTDSFNSVVAASDGYVMAGQTYSALNASQDVYIVKTDLIGNRLWSNTIGGVNDQIGHGIVAVSDGYVIAGWAKGVGGDWDIYLIKVDLNGELIWEHQYGAVMIDETGNSIAVTSDGGFIITGYRKDTGIQDILLTYTDSAGILQWSRSYDGSPGSEIGNYVIAVSDGYVVAGGSDGWDNPVSDVVLMKTLLDGTLQWRKTYGGPAFEWGYGVVATSDGGFIVAGDTKSYGNGSYEAYLVKTGPDGTMEWDRAYGGTGGDTFYSVVQVNDGYIIGGGTTSWGTSGSADAWLVKTDLAGTELWAKTYGGSGYDEVWAAVPTSDGYVLAGWTQSFVAGNWDAYLIITDPDGNMPYQSQVGGGPNDEYAQSVIAVSDGYVTTGTADMGTTGMDIFLGKTDLNLNYVWQKTYRTPGDQAAYQVISTGDGYLIVGYTKPGTYSDGYVLKTDLDGNMLWDVSFGGAGHDCAYGVAPLAGGYMITGQSQVGAQYDAFAVMMSTAGVVGTMSLFGDPSGDDAGSSIAPVSDGCVIAGYTTTPGNGVDVYLVKVDPTGSPIWQRTFGGAGDDYGNSLVAVSDGFVIAGRTDSFSSGLDVYLAKRDLNGNPLWENPINGGANEEGWSIAATGDGYIVSGVTDKGTSNSAYLVKTSLNGDVAWEKTFGGTGDETGTSVAAASDGYIVAGWTDSYGSGGYDVYMIKVNKYTPAVSTVNLFYDKISLPEGKTGFQVRIVRSDHLDTICSVAYTTADGTALMGQDYQAKAGSVTFNPDETSKVIRVAIIDDRKQEGAEIFTFRLTSAIFADIDKATTVCEIRANDPLGTV